VVGVVGEPARWMVGMPGSGGAPVDVAVGEWGVRAGCGTSVVSVGATRSSLGAGMVVGVLTRWMAAPAGPCADADAGAGAVWWVSAGGGACGSAGAVRWMVSDGAVLRWMVLAGSGMSLGCSAGGTACSALQARDVAFVARPAGVSRADGVLDGAGFELVREPPIEGSVCRVLVRWI
jgi:hypothetical protein